MGNEIKEKLADKLMTFLQAESARLRMNVPTPAAVRDTIEVMAAGEPDWEQTEPEKFARLLVERYPELRFEWTDPVTEESGELADEPATEKQIAYLKVLEAPIPEYLGMREASDLIDKYKNRISDGQKRRLDFYKIKYEPSMTREDATALIDQYKAQHPESEQAYQEWKARAER